MPATYIKTTLDGRKVEVGRERRAQRGKKIVLLHGFL